MKEENQEVKVLLKKLNKSMAIALISHDLGVISTYVTTVACLNRQLHYHGDTEIGQEELEKTYQCPVELLAHGKTPHRVLKEHEKKEDKTKNTKLDKNLSDSFSSSSCFFGTPVNSSLLSITTPGAVKIGYFSKNSGFSVTSIIS